MATEKYIRGKKDGSRHHGRRSERRRLDEAINQIKEYMSHERYTEEERKKIPFRNEEWYKLRGKENRYPNQFGGIGDNGDGAPRDVMRREDVTEEEATQLEGRGVVFPFEIAQPGIAVTFETEREWFGGIREAPRPEAISNRNVVPFPRHMEFMIVPEEGANVTHLVPIEPNHLDAKTSPDTQ